MAELAVKEGLTIYDASYIYVAMLNKFILVTDSRKLLNIARKYVITKTTNEVSTATNKTSGYF